jgi:hypothetical protein
MHTYFLQLQVWLLTGQHNIEGRRQTSVLKAEFEHTIPVSKRPRPTPHTERPLGPAPLDRNGTVLHTLMFIVAATKFHASRSQQTHTTLQHEQRSPGEWRQLRIHTVLKLATLYRWLRAARYGDEVLPWPWSMQFGDGYYSVFESSRDDIAVCELASLWLAIVVFD